MTALLVLYMSQALFMPGHIDHIAGFNSLRHALESVFGPMSTRFEPPKTMKELLKELAARGTHYRDTNLTDAMQTLVKSQELRRKKYSE
jgi:hypothetical protein